MRLSSKYLSLALLPPTLALPLLLAPAASADPVPGMGQAWPLCGVAPDDDGRYCIASVTRNGMPMPVAAGPADGPYEVPYVNLLGPGEIGIGVYSFVRSGGTLGDDLGQVDPSSVWAFDLNTGAEKPTELGGNLRDVSLSLGGDAITGWTATITLRPVPIAWLVDPAACTFENGCGDTTTVADQVYSGFVSAKLVDGATSGVPPAAIAARVGYVEAFNAQGISTRYDFDANALVVGMVNPHLSALGAPAVGYYETFLPDPWLIRNYHVPDPTTLTTGSFTVTRTGSALSVPFSVTREGEGVWIRISGITFSAPEFRVRPKPSVPGVPRWGSVTRVDAHAVKVRFRAPVADGGAALTSYTARCRRGDQAWQRASGGRSPLLVRDVPRKAVSCQVRALNRIGPGPWSSLRVV